MTLDINALIDRERVIKEWLDDNAPYCFADQKHLDEGSRERAYWHYGYRAALVDVINKIQSQ